MRVTPPIRMSVQVGNQVASDRLGGYVGSGVAEATDQLVSTGSINVAQLAKAAYTGMLVSSAASSVGKVFEAGAKRLSKAIGGTGDATATGAASSTSNSSTPATVGGSAAGVAEIGISACQNGAKGCEGN